MSGPMVCDHGVPVERLCARCTEQGAYRVEPPKGDGYKFEELRRLLTWAQGRLETPATPEPDPVEKVLCLLEQMSPMERMRLVIEGAARGILDTEPPE